MSWTKKERRTVLLLCFALIFLTLAAFEVGLWILRPSPYQRDELLGWKLKENFERQFPQTTFGGQEYQVSFATNADGLRAFGSNDKAPIRILVLGDSYTADPYASNNSMWYAEMAKGLAKHAHRPLQDFYVLAGGGGGWGTYQSLLLSQTLSRTVKPDLFVLQFCSNDFQNNSYEWESEGVVRGQYMRRPFASFDSDRPKYAPGVMAWIYRSVLGQSRLLNRIDTLVGGIQFGIYGGYIRPLPAKTEAAYERRSVALTTSLLGKLRKLYNGIPAVMVNCDGSNAGLNRQWEKMARDAGFIPIAGPSDFLHALKPGERKKFLNVDGSHLSNDGNRSYGAIAGDEIAAHNFSALRK